MAEEELLGIDEHPAEVLGTLPKFFRRGEVLDGGGQLGGGRFAAQSHAVEFLRDLRGQLAALDQPGDSTVVVAKLAVDRRSADQLESLGEVRVALTLTFAGELASRP